MIRSIITASIFFLFLNIYLPAWSQEEKKTLTLTAPLKGELHLSGSFGEVRTNSFHAGIDFRTGGKVGKRVYASESGYVSRIKVSGTGFGKALYINHPNGTTTVYAHLNGFAQQIAAYVKEYQYKKEQFEVNIHLAPGTFKIKKGEFIGYTGNTGSSGGPHLHYEVRRTSSQTPINPSFSTLPIIDTLPPVIYSLWGYPADSSSYINEENIKKEIIGKVNGLDKNINDTIRAYGTIGLGIETYDFINRGSLRCGVYSIKMLVNTNLIYHYLVDQFSYNEIRYANSHLDYGLTQLSGKRIHKLYKEPNNRFSGYKIIKNNGFIKVKKDSIYNVTITVHDAHKNTSKINLTIVGTNKPNVVNGPARQKNNVKNEKWLFYKENTLITEDFKISIPKNSLYKNIEFTYDTISKLSNKLSPIIRLHNNLTPLHRDYNLAIKVDSLPTHLRDKALIATFSLDGDLKAVGGKYSNGYVSATTNSFGDFIVEVDTVPPVITPLNIVNKKRMTNEKSIRFTVDDNLSGVKSIEGTINNQWALFKHDPKNNLVFYEFDKERLEKRQEHTLTLKVNDNKDNLSEYRCTFIW